MRGFAGVLVAALLVAGCGKPAELAADKAWVRLPAVSGRPGAAYFTVHGGKAGDTLLAVTTPAALRTELHESVATNGVTSMRPIRDVAIQANGTLAFAPGGKHVMLFDLGPQVQAGATIPLALSFAGGKRIEVQAKVVGAGDAAPSGS